MKGKKNREKVERNVKKTQDVFHLYLNSRFLYDLHEVT